MAKMRFFKWPLTTKLTLNHSPIYFWFRYYCLYRVLDVEGDATVSIEQSLHILNKLLKAGVYVGNF